MVADIPNPPSGIAVRWRPDKAVAVSPDGAEVWHFSGASPVRLGGRDAGRLAAAVDGQRSLEGVIAHAVAAGMAVADADRIAPVARTLRGGEEKKRRTPNSYGWARLLEGRSRPKKTRAPTPLRNRARETASVAQPKGAPSRKLESAKAPATSSSQSPSAGSEAKGRKALRSHPWAGAFSFLLSGCCRIAKESTVFYGAQGRFAFPLAPHKNPALNPRCNGGSDGQEGKISRSASGKSKGASSK